MVAVTNAPATPQTTSVQPAETVAKPIGAEAYDAPLNTVIAVSATDAATHSKALAGLMMYYDKLPKDKDGYVTRASLQEVVDSPKDYPPNAVAAARYFLDNKAQFDALDTARQKYEDKKPAMDGKVSREDIYNEQLHPDVVSQEAPKTPTSGSETPKGKATSGSDPSDGTKSKDSDYDKQKTDAQQVIDGGNVEKKHYGQISRDAAATLPNFHSIINGFHGHVTNTDESSTPPPTTTPPAAKTDAETKKDLNDAEAKSRAESEAWRKEIDARDAAQSPAPTTTADAKAKADADPKTKADADPKTTAAAADTVKTLFTSNTPLGGNYLQSIAEGKNTQYPIGSPQQAAAAQVFKEDPDFYKHYCDNKGNFTPADLDRLKDDVKDKAVVLNPLEKEVAKQYNALDANTPAFRYKNGDPTPAMAIASKAALDANDAERSAALTGSFGNSPAELSRAMVTLRSSDCLFGKGDAKASIKELQAVADGTGNGGIEPTAKEINAAKVLLADYKAQGYKNGSVQADDAHFSVMHAVSGNSETFDKKGWDAIAAAIPVQVEGATGSTVPKTPVTPATPSRTPAAADTVKTLFTGNTPLGGSYLKGIAEGKNPQYPIGSPQQDAAAQIFKEDPDFYKHYCDNKGNFTPADLDRLKDDVKDKAVVLNPLDKEVAKQYNALDANSPAFHYKNGDPTPALAIASKAALDANDAERSAALTGSFGNSPAELKRAMVTLRSSDCLYGKGDAKASIKELQAVADGTGVGGIKPTAKESNAAKVLLADYKAQGYKNGSVQADDAHFSVMHAVSGNSETFDKKGWDAITAAIPEQVAM